MKRKGITIWEQYLERFVLGAAALFFVVFATLQILSQPNAGTLQGETVDPGEVDGLLLEKAEIIQAQLTEEAPPAAAIPDHRPVLDDFSDALTGSISPELMVAFPGPRIAPGKGTVPPPRTDQPYIVPDIAAPHSVVAVQGFDGIDPEYREQTPEVQQLFPEAPYDVTWITTVSVFNLASVIDQFRQEGPNGELPIPFNWYNNQIEVLNVKIEREEWADGEWANPVTLNELPAMSTGVRTYLEVEEPDKGTREAIFARLATPGVREVIVHPEFYPTVNESFSPPDPRLEIEEPESGEGDLDPDAARIRALERRRANLIKQRDSVIQRIIGLGGTPAPEGAEPDTPDSPDRPGGRRPPGGGRRPPGGGGSAPGGGAAPPGGGLGGPEGGGRRGMPGGGGIQGEQERNQKRIEGLQRRLSSLRNQIATVTEQIKALSPDIELESAEEQPNIPWWEQDEVLVWAHDIDIQPGKSYRYRFTVELYNPFFARRLNLRADQHDLAGPIAIASRTSEWSERVDVIPASKVFITKASPRGPEGLGGRNRAAQATAEIYRFFNGRWWLDTARVEIGERVGTVKSIRRQGDLEEPQTIDFATRWFVLDIIEDIDASERDVERGFGAMALLQSLDDPNQTRLDDPRVVFDDKERRRLREAVQRAEEEASRIASAG